MLSTHKCIWEPGEHADVCASLISHFLRELWPPESQEICQHACINPTATKMRKICMSSLTFNHVRGGGGNGMLSFDVHTIMRFFRIGWNCSIFGRSPLSLRWKQGKLPRKRKTITQIWFPKSMGTPSETLWMDYTARVKVPKIRHFCWLQLRRYWTALSQIWLKLTGVKVCKGKLRTYAFRGYLFQSICTFLDLSTPGVKVDHAHFSQIHLTQYLR